MSSDIDCVKCATDWKYFRYLTESEKKRLNENWYGTTFNPGEMMIKQGAPSSNALFISKGYTKTFIEVPNRKTFIISIAQPGQLIIGPGSYVNARHSYSVSAITSLHACFISFDIIKQFTKDNGKFASDMLEDISCKALKSHVRMVNMSQKKMPGRLAEVLLHLADEVFFNDEFDMLISRQEVSEMTNMARENVVRILTDLEDSGVIQTDSSLIRILNKEKLIEISEKG